MQDIIQQLDAKRSAARLGGGRKRIDHQHAKGKLVLNSEFIDQTKKKIDLGPFELVADAKEEFKGLPSYWTIVVDNTNKYGLHKIERLVKLSESTYLTCTVEVYGDKEVFERICESNTILNSIKILE